jgi:hemolysin activation/secretion protein
MQRRNVSARTVALSLAFAISTGSIAAIPSGCDAAAAPTTNAAPGSSQPRFTIREYRVLGNSVLPPRDIEALLYPLLGEGKDLSDVQAARAALEKLYHDHGFGTVFVDIPPQAVADGIVRLRVTEGTIHERKIDGARYFSERDIVSALPATEVGTVPNLTALQQQLNALNNQSADRSVVPILKAGPVPGTMDMELKVNDKLPLHGSVELNDDYTVDTKPLRATVALSYANLFAALDQVSVQYQNSPQEPSEVSVLDASYTSRPFWGGDSVSAYYIVSNSNVPNVGVGANGVLGNGDIGGLRWNFPALVSAAGSQDVTLGLDYKRFRDTVTVGGGSAPLVTPIKYTLASLSYVGSWHWPVADVVVQTGPALGIRGAPNSPSDFENDRYLARPNFSYLRWDGSFTLHAPAGYRLTLRFAGQYTTQPLISNESYSIGGIDGVRGYLEAEELGDTAIKGTVQVQTPTVSWHVPQLFNAIVFFDAGRTTDYSVLPGQPDELALDSFGGGLNLLPGHAVTGTLIWADPLRTGSYTHEGQSRVLFSVRGAF